MFKASAVVAVAALGILSLTAPASAQNCTNTPPASSCTVTTTASVTIPALIDMTVAGGGAVTLTPPTASDLTGNGYVQDAGPSITVKSNRTWKLQVHTTNVANWTYTSGGQSGVKPTTDLTWSNTAAGTYVAITGAATDVTANNARTNSATPTIFFRTLYPNDFSSDRNAAGTYTIALVFTLSAP